MNAPHSEQACGGLFPLTRVAASTILAASTIFNLLCFRILEKMSSGCQDKEIYIFRIFHWLQVKDLRMRNSS